MRTFFATVTGTIAALVLLLFSARIVSDSWMFFTPSSFQIHGAFLAFGLALLSFVFRRHVASGLIMLAALSLAVHGFLLLDRFSYGNPNAPAEKPIFRLLSFNIMGNNIANGKKLADYIVGSGADVVLIQESAPIGPFIPQIKLVYPYRLGCGAETITCDQSLWSKRPLANGVVRTASPIYRDRLMLASVDFDGKIINFANVHLTKPFFDNFHAIELAKVRAALEPYKENLVLAGDFNASILPTDVQEFLEKTGLRTAETEPNTWPVEAPALGMAIDHVFASPPLFISSIKRIPDPIGSNHYGLLAEITVDNVTATMP